MAKRTNRQRNIRIPYNIWDGGGPHTLRDDETVCEECEGHGGHSDSNETVGLIRCCSSCGGKGYKDWIDRARGPSEEHQEYTYFITNTADEISAAVKKGQEEEYMEKIKLQHTGVYRFIKKGEL